MVTCSRPERVTSGKAVASCLQDLPEYLAAPLNLAVEKLDDSLE